MVRRLLNTVMLTYAICMLAILDTISPKYETHISPIELKEKEIKQDDDQNRQAKRIFIVVTRLGRLEGRAWKKRGS